MSKVEVAVLWLIVPFLAHVAAVAPPHIVFILADDLVSCHLYYRGNYNYRYKSKVNILDFLLQIKEVIRKMLNRVGTTLDFTVRVRYRPRTSMLSRTLASCLIGIMYPRFAHRPEAL